jgi:hypothetical protein
VGAAGAADAAWMVLDRIDPKPGIRTKYVTFALWPA